MPRLVCQVERQRVAMIRLWRLTSGWRDMKTSFMLEQPFGIRLLAGFDRLQGVGSKVEGVGKEFFCRQLTVRQEILPGGSTIAGEPQT
jgi:hypothetical protein